jgi:hypothetical protein
MHKRNKRVLWLLNHKTLMPYEVKLLLELGYEVFTPKVIPQAASFRSGAIDFSYDDSLSIPPRVLKRLNSFNFYEEAWPDDIVALMNRYFGTVYVIPYGKQVPEAVRKFEGQIMFRAFGLDNTQTYHNVLQLLYGERILNEIAALGKRFWFASGYDQLVEVEPLLFSEREVFLPLGVPESFWRTADTYVGTDRHILFVCPNAVTNPYYAAVYRKFKEDFGDLPHVIFGAQDVPVDDPHMLGFVTDEELARLYRESAVLYYHSTEQRHVHYSPIEAAINGMPVVYFADSLLGRMTPEIELGRCTSQEQARAAVERILAGDQDFIDAMRQQQRALAYKFSDEYCRAVWTTNLRERGVEAALAPEPTATVYWREFKRTLLRPFAHGLSQLPTKVRPPKPPRELVTTAETDDANLGTLADGIDFSQPKYPKFVEDVTGVSFPEPTGRWTDGKTVLISLSTSLPRRFVLEIVGGAYGENVNAPVTVKIGRAKRLFRFEEGASTQQRVTLEFSTLRRGSLIEIRVPHPTIPPNDNRMVGLMLAHIRILPAQRDSAPEREETAVAA